MKLCFVARRSIYRYFTEYMDAVFYWFNQCSVQSQLIFDEDPKLYELIDSMDYIINVQMLLLDIQKVKNPFQKIIIFNTEQNTRKNSVYLEHVLELIKIGFKVMDYHFGNIKLMNEITEFKYKDKIFYLPALYNPNDKHLYNSLKTKDMCFVGTITEYRSKFLNKLSKKFNIDVIEDFGQIRDKKMSDYRIILNLHADVEYQVFETIRCYRCVFNKILVVSQQKKYKENSPIENFCYFTSDENLEKTLELVLNNYEMIMDQKYKNHDKAFFMDWSKNKMLEFIQSLF